tara:strand:+ start:28237 stop:28494 length:258 start_codon:yes stop_codon:yes gene_type:complete
MNINIWESQDKYYGVLKTSKELLKHVDNILLQLIDSSIDDLKADSFEELMNYLEESTTEELNTLVNYTYNDDRLIRCIEIVLNKK